MPPAISHAETGAPRGRIIVIAAVLFLWGGLVSWRLADLQVLRADQMTTLARKQQEQVMSLDARRGLIYDRRGRELAMSIEVDSVYAVPAEIDDPAGTAAALARVLGPDTGVPALASRLTGDRLFVWLRRKVDPEVRAAVKGLGLKGIGFAREHKRFYPHGRLASHVMGWVGMDNEGMEGLELQFDARIRGQNGKVFALRDARGKKFLKVTQREPVAGQSMVLTIDQTIQYVAERELGRAMEQTGAKAGTVIVLAPATGDILALANTPDYNLNSPSAADAEARKNRAIVDAYEPGSTFKVVTMAAALERGLLRPAEIIDCNNGSLRVGRALIRDHKSFGLLSASEVLQYSSNVGAMKIGSRLGEKDFYDTIRRFGFGTRTGIDLPGEARGLIRDTKDWSGVSQATLSFGQELSVTPLQLVTAIAAVANGGVLQPPRLLLRELDAAGQARVIHEPKQGRRILSEETVRVLLPMMSGVVDDGTAKAARLPGYSVAGKTGTAQKIGPEGTYAAGRFVASFVGFAPVSRPAVVILVVLDEPRGSLYHGGDIAAPVFARIALPSLRHLGVPPEEGRLFDAGDDAGGQLAASAHASRWVDPVPLGHEEVKVEQQRKAREEMKAASRRSRRNHDGKEKDDETVPQPVELARRPPPDAGPSMDGNGPVVVADLTGQPLRRAVTWLARAGLKARLDAVTGAPDGLVVAQEPVAGTAVSRGSVVVVSTGLMVMPQETVKEEAAGVVVVAPASETREVKRAPARRSRPPRRVRS